MGRFEDLKVWQKGVDLAIAVYEIVKDTALHKDFGLKDQMHKSNQLSFFI